VKAVETAPIGNELGTLVLEDLPDRSVGLFGMGMVLSWLSSVVNPVYRCALYIYATEGVIPETFDRELLDSAWKVK